MFQAIPLKVCYRGFADCFENITWTSISHGCVLGFIDYITELSSSGPSGPLVEYERRIAAGELVDGDNCQVLMNS